jgi:dienelactone hydrolase
LAAFATSRLANVKFARPVDWNKVERMMRTCIPAVLLMLIAVFAAQEARADEATELNRVWANTLVVIPQEPDVYFYRAERNLDLAIEKLTPGKKYPAVVFLHGCSGLSLGSTQVTRMIHNMAAAGFVVFAPNSLDRPHPPYCDPKTLKSYIDFNKVGLRIAEAKMVRERIANFDWIDTENVFLAGHSMGGMTTHNYAVADHFRGYVVLGYHCGPHTDRRLEGIKTPAGRPILSVLGDADEWFAGGPNRAVNCGQYMRAHSAGKSVVLKEAPHDISAHPDGMKLVVEFLRSNFVASHQ